MPYTLTQAAQAAGRNRSTILRAIIGGKVSATRDPATNGWLIEPAELHRIYSVAPTATGNDANAMLRNGAAPGATADVIGELRARLADAQDQVADLRRRLDRADEQRQQAQAQLAALLADQRPAPPAPASDPPRSAWRRVLRALGHVR